MALFVAWILAMLVGTNTESECNPPKRVANLTGDVIIAGLIPVHVKAEHQLNEPGVMWVEAMMFAIREINEDQNLLPNITLGFDIRDSCNQIDLALGTAIEFLLSPNENQASSYVARKDNVNRSLCLCNSNKTSFPPVMAVVGGASSRISSSVSPIFSVDNIPQISYSSTSPSLSDKTRFRSFLRTIPSDVYQARVIADILNHFNWTYVSIVVSDDEYGRHGLIALRTNLKMKGICIAEEGKFTPSPRNETQRDSYEIVRRLQQARKATVVVLWCEWPLAIEFLQVATGKLVNVTWIGTESWGDNANVKNTIDFDTIGGMLGVLPYLGRNAKFEKHLENLTPKTKDTEVNPWLNEYWLQDKFKDNKCVQFPSNCSNYQLPNASSLPPNKYANVMDAVYAVAHGLHDMSIFNRKNDVTLDKQMLGELMNHIKKVRFQAQSGKGHFMFTETGDPEYGAYLIKNLQRNGGKKEFVRIGRWDGEVSKTNFSEDVKIQWNTGRSSVPVSRCSEDCTAGFYYVKSDVACCWSCLKCSDGYYKNSVGNTNCNKCPNGYISNDNRTECVKQEEDYLRWGSALSIVLLVVSFLGLVLIVFVIVVFRKYSQTAVVKASNRELSLVHFICHGLIFLLPLLFYGRPTSSTCILRAYFFSVLFTVITSIMFLKTDRIVRIFNSKSRLTKRSRLLSNKMQFVMTFVLAFIPTVGTTVWILYKPLDVTAERITSVEIKFVVFCGDNATTLHLIQLSYILFLALLCTYEAYNARRLPENFNEAKFICFSMFGFVLMWAGYIPGYIGSTGSTKQFMTCLFSLLTNVMTLVLIYGPKLNIILLHPKDNRHETFREATLNSCMHQVRRLSPGVISTTSRETSLCLVNASQAATLGLNFKPRSSSELTIDSIGSRESLFGSSRPGENRNLPPSPLVHDKPSTTSYSEPLSESSSEPSSADPSSTPGRDVEECEDNPRSSILGVKDQPVLQLTDSEGVANLSVTFSV